MSNTRPPAVRIDDLADPQFAPAIAELMQQMEPVAAALRFEPDGVRDQAVSEASELSFGDDDFRERLEVLLRALDTDTVLSPMGRVSADSQLVGHLLNRLRIEALVATHPEILEVEIRRPIVIVGQPRTGTTHLHNLMAADPSCAQSPTGRASSRCSRPASRPPSVRRARPTPRPHRGRPRPPHEAAPYFRRMHEMTVDHVHEEIQLLAIDFSTMLFETIAVLPTWRDAYLAPTRPRRTGT